MDTFDPMRKLLYIFFTSTLKVALSSSEGADPLISEEALSMEGLDFHLVEGTLPPQEQEVDWECCDDSCVVCDVDSWAGLRYTGGRGLGWEGGYLTLEGLFFADLGHPRIWPFLDLRVHYLTERDMAVNAGVGFRFIPACSRVFLGFNAYFDYRSSGEWDRHFTQAGLGFEILSDCWEFRVNGYLPIKKKGTVKECRFFYPGGHFIFRDRVEGAFRGVDMEVGRYFWRDCCCSLYTGIGPYYYGKQCDGTVIGGRFRLELEYCNRLYIGGGVTHDELYNTRAYGEIGIRLPIGCQRECQTFCERRMSQRVYRNDLIVTDEFCDWDFNYRD